MAIDYQKYENMFKKSAVSAQKTPPRIPKGKIFYGNTETGTGVMVPGSNRTPRNTVSPKNLSVQANGIAREEAGGGRPVLTPSFRDRARKIGAGASNLARGAVSRLDDLTEGMEGPGTLSEDVSRSVGEMGGRFKEAYEEGGVVGAIGQGGREIVGGLTPIAQGAGDVLFGKDTDVRSIINRAYVKGVGEYADSRDAGRVSPASAQPEGITPERPRSGIVESIGSEGERSFTNAPGYTGRPAGEPGRTFYGAEDITDMTPKQRMDTKIAAMGRTGQTIRETREIAAGGSVSGRRGGLTPGRGMPESKRKGLLQEYQTKLREVMDDIRDYKVTRGGGANIIAGLKDFYGEALGLSPRQEEAGKDYRTGLAVEGQIEQTGILEKGRTARALAKDDTTKDTFERLAPGEPLGNIVRTTAEGQQTVVMPPAQRAAYEEYQNEVAMSGGDPDVEEEARQKYFTRYPDALDPRSH